MKDTIERIVHNLLIAALLAVAVAVIYFALIFHLTAQQTAGRRYAGCFGLSVWRCDMQWEPIETAPKDGTPILAYSPDGKDYFTRWYDDVWAVQGGKGGPSGWFSGNYADNYGDRPILDEPTHWLPLLPPPPSTVTLSCASDQTLVTIANERDGRMLFMDELNAAEEGHYWINELAKKHGATEITTRSVAGGGVVVSAWKRYELLACFVLIRDAMNYTLLVRNDLTPHA